MKIAGIFRKAQTSPFYLWLLNRILGFTIPFNRPHRLRIMRITGKEIEIKIPYRRANLNHLKGLHACGLATVAEYASGLLLISRIDPARYRIIMQSMEMEYHYQGKSDGVARFSLDEQWLAENVFQPLRDADSIVITPQVNVYDAAGNHLMTGTVRWHIKRWEKVRTAVD